MELREDRLPGARIARTDADAREPELDWPRARSRLFGVLAWAGAGFAGITALSFVLFELLDTALLGVGIGRLGGASICVAIGFAGCLGVRAVALSLGEDRRPAAKVLLWVTTLGYAVLVNVFAATYNLTDDAQEGFDFVLLVAGSVAAAGVGVLGALAIGILIGLGSRVRTFVRWLAIVGLVTGGFVVNDPSGVLAGLLAGLMLAGLVHLTFVVVLEHPHVPEPALAAILVSAVTAIVIWLIYLSIRFGLRLSGGMLWGAIKS